jgi:oligoribonuclease NrnB/cAMP/cGMP phosphodiesterase (DHH superfamily)
MKPFVLFHGSCFDGFCAAWIAKTALGDIDAVPVQYGRPAPDVTGREVYILDFSYARDDLIAIHRAARSLVVLDHHKTAQDALAGLDFCTFDLHKSGGRLAWEYFADLGGWLGMSPPWLVAYTEDRDLWRHALPHSHAVNAALRSYPLDFDLWTRQFAGAGPPPQSLVIEGEAIRRREHQIITTHLQWARPVEFEGHIGRMVNATVLFSEIAGELAKDQPFGACYFDRQDGTRVWSLRSTPDGVDVSVIAKAHGGGGHPHAAGFETTP